MALQSFLLNLTARDFALATLTHFYQSCSNKAEALKVLD